MLINVKYPHNFDLSKDTVRPELDMAYRLNKGREVYKYLNEDEIVAVVCVAYTNKIPTTIESLHSLSKYHAKIVVPYTVWSLKGGFGATIIFSLIDHLKKERRWSVLSLFLQRLQWRIDFTQEMAPSKLQQILNLIIMNTF